MKKKKQPVPKEKAFTSSPFGALKGVRTADVPQPKASPPPPPKKPVEPDDTELFLRAMGGVKQLDDASVPAPGSAPPVRKAQLPVARKIDDEERRIFLQALEGLHLDVTFRDGNDEEPSLPPISVNRMRQLRRGSIRIDYELDLHGLTRDEAVESLTRFISGAYRRGQKAVLVITGKGNHSPGEPVLVGAVSGWLRDKGKGMVAEFSPAPRQMGGGGAFVVFLKDKPEEGAIKGEKQ